MKELPRPAHTSLRQGFNRRLMLLLLLVCILSSSLIIFAFERHSDSLNRNELENRLSYVNTRIESQHHLAADTLDTLYSAMQWSGALDISSPKLAERLSALIQTQTTGKYGVRLVEQQSGKILAEAWQGAGAGLPKAPSRLSKLWMDERQNVLYSHTAKTVELSGRAVTIHFFKAWDSALLANLTPPGTTAFITAGSQVVLSSAGSLVLENTPPSGHGYIEYPINGVPYHEDARWLSEAELTNGQMAGLKLVVREPISSHFSLAEVMLTALMAMLLFALLLFGLFGRWLGRIGARLDMLSLASVQIKNDSESMLRSETSQLLKQAHAGKNDQISLVALELSNLIDTLAIRSDEQNSYLQTLDLLQDAVIEITTEGKLIRATDAFRMLTGGTVGGLCSISNCVHKDDSEEVLEQISGLVYKQKQQISIRFRILRMDEPDAYLWVEGRFAPITQNNNVVCIRGVLRDINNSYRQERQISHMALHDALTDLPNRVLLEDRIDLAISLYSHGRELGLDRATRTNSMAKSTTCDYAVA